MVFRTVQDISKHIKHPTETYIPSLTVQMVLLLATTIFKGTRAHLISRKMCIHRALRRKHTKGVWRESKLRHAEYLAYK